MRAEDYAAIERHIRAPPAVVIPEPPDHAQRQDRTAAELRRALERSRPAQVQPQGESHETH